MTNDVDTLATALYATTDDMLREHPDLAPWRPPVGITPLLSDAELVTLATMQAVLDYTSEAKWLRHTRAHLRHLFPYLPQQPGYNKRLRKAAGLMRSVNRTLATTTSVWSDEVGVMDSTPAECGRSRETVKRSDLAGWAEYGYCASHSRFVWGRRLHLVCTLQGLSIAFALTGGPRPTNGRPSLTSWQPNAGLCERAPDRLSSATRTTSAVVSNANCASMESSCCGLPVKVNGNGLAQPCSGRCDRSSNRPTRPSRDSLTSNGTEGAHGGVIARVVQRILALTAAIWHNAATGKTVLRSLIAYDHWPLGIDHLVEQHRCAAD